MRVLNRTDTVRLGRAGGRSVEAVVQTRGLDARVRGRGFVFERRDPQSVLLRGEDDVTRLALPQAAQNLPALVIPVVGYAIVRALVTRRRKT